MNAVLLVEDEALVRPATAEQLDDLGCDVIEASSAAEAISILESRSDITLVFTDVNMPGMDGLALAAAVRKRWPPIRLLVTSALAVRDRVPEGAQFLPKPYQREGLERSFAELLA